MYENKKIGVVLPAYNEEQNIKKAIKDFYCNIYNVEVIVVDNNSKDNTNKIASRTRAKVVKEYKQGYGAAMRRGMYEAVYTHGCDIIFTVEPDDTFTAKDIPKFLEYIDSGFDVVFGTRTNKSTIMKGAKMGKFLRYGNIVVAKLLEYLHFKNLSMTDVGCSFKCMTLKAYLKMKPYFTKYDNSFSPDMMISCAKAKLKCVEIPVIYKKRVGDSSITDTHWKSFKLGMKMIKNIIVR